MCQLVALRTHLPATEEKLLLVLRCRHAVEHNRQITARGVLHADRNAYAARNHAVQLVLAGACTHSGIAQKIGQIAEHLGIEDFLRTRKACFLHHAHVHLADSDDASQHILLALGRGLVQHALIAYADCARLVGI